MRTNEMETYRIYTAPAELHKAVNSLRGMVAGISADGCMGAAETQELLHWCSIHENLRDRHPFSELLPVVERALLDGQIDDEERQNILWLCGNFVDDCKYYDLITSALQYLNGLVHGMLADGELSDAEILALREWLNANDYLMGCWPFDEIHSLVNSILADHRITEEERGTLMAFLGNVVEFKDSYNLHEADFAKLREQYSVQGICAFCPEIEFAGKSFVFTGESAKAKRSEIYGAILQLGGVGRDAVSSATDYLVVGAGGNPCWAYSCYGRKIEKAVQLRKGGAKVQIVHENDFWDAAYDAGVEI